MRVLVVNAGSSSVKLRVLDEDDDVLVTAGQHARRTSGSDVGDLLEQATRSVTGSCTAVRTTWLPSGSPTRWSPTCAV